MYFKRIDIQGFKSFAEPVSIEFHDGITCIVGPNGSGKSNISDAIRWVLGEQSPKMLRGGKMEEVIFSGTANRKSRGMAEVTLTIDNTGHILPIEYSEVAITRRMYRSGESEYSINKVPCRLRDIRELIMDTGIGVDGYSIIGQGKIADLISSRPESRREIFEEAAGIVKYRSKKEEAERKLEGSKGNLERVNDIIGEIESRIGGLKEESEKAAEYIALRDEYKKLEINIILKNVEAIELKNEYIKDDMSELADQIETVRLEKESIDKEVATNRERSRELEHKGDVTRDRLMALAGDINSLTSLKQLCGEKTANLGKDRERITEELSVLAQKKVREEENRETLLDNRREIEKKLAELEAEFQTKNLEYNQLSREMEEADKTASESRDRIYEGYTAVSDKKAEISSLVALKDTLVKRKNQVLSEKENAHAEGSRSNVERQQASIALDEWRKTLKEAEGENRSAMERYNGMVAREKELRRGLEDLKVEISQASARRKMIEEMESAYEGYNHGVRFLMKSGLSGIHGVVADLIQVPSGFETAIETALGAALQNIVCSEDKDAQAAISALKQNKAGRLTFLPVQSIKANPVPRDQNLIQGEGFLGFASDCIRFDPKYQTVMEYLLGRVIVVDKLSNALLLSKKAQGNLRFVTREGEIINTGGAITGGAYISNTVGLLERKSEATRLEETLKALQSKQQMGTKDLEEIQKKMLEASLAIETWSKTVRDREREVIAGESMVQRLAQLLSDAEAAGERWDQELLSIRQEEEKADQMIESLKAEADRAEEGIHQAETLAEEANRLLEDRKNTAKSKGEEITAVRLALSTANGEKNHLDQLLARIGGTIKEYAEEETARQQRLLFSAEEEEALKLEDGRLAAELIEKESTKASVEEGLKEIQSEREELLRFTDEIEQKRETIETTLLGYQTEKHELSMKLMKNETQIETFKERLWEDFEISWLQAMDFRKNDFVMAVALRESRDIKSRMRELGEVNIGSIKEYESVKERYEFLTTQRQDLLSAMDALLSIIEDMDRTIRKSFKESFDQIVANFSEAFQALFGGGTAELRLEDETKPLETGIEIVAQPPGKKLQNINLLSGGEKTMTAIALMFAILRAKPTPFCILDEVEAALDDANIGRFADYLRDFRTIQFTLVTHQKATMEYADVLYGVTMPEQGISKVISLKLGDEFAL